MDMKNWKSAILKSCMLLAAVFLIGAAVPASVKAAPKLSSKKITLKVGQKKKLKVRNVKKKKIKWSSKNNDIVNIPLHFFFTKSFKLLVLMYHSIVFV